MLDRVRRAILAISVVTLAEARFGHLKAGWGPTKVDQDERRLASFLHIPLDTAVVDEWARMRYETERKGQSVGHNDLWIAATASVRGYPLVTCDDDQSRIDDPALEIIHLAPPR